jgi:hypothetical protein
MLNTDSTIGEDLQSHDNCNYFIGASVTDDKVEFPNHA